MPRTYANITTSIWRDDDFRALTATEQAVYFTLNTQAEITAAGTLPLTRGRWSKMSAGMTPALLGGVIEVLVDRGFIVIDEDTEELLVRTFVKWDQGYLNQKRRPVIEAAALAIASSVLRATLAIEFAKLGLSDMASKLVRNTTPRMAPDTASHEVSPSDRVVVTEVVPLATLNPQPAIPVPQPAAEPMLGDTPTAQTLIANWIDHCTGGRPPGRVVGHIARLVDEMLAEGIDGDHISRGLAAWSDKGLHPSVLPSVVHELMNSRPATANRSQQATDQLFDEAAKRMGVTT